LALKFAFAVALGSLAHSDRDAILEQRPLIGPGHRKGLESGRNIGKPETLEAVQGYTLLRTDRNGWIELSTDGEQLWVEVERR
jgi:hypothetical protein